MVPRDRRLTLFIRRQRDRTDSASYFDGACVPGGAHHVVPGTMTYPLGHCGGRSANAVPVSATEPSSPIAVTTMPDTIHLRASDILTPPKPCGNSLRYNSFRRAHGRHTRLLTSPTRPNLLLNHIPRTHERFTIGEICTPGRAEITGAAPGPVLRTDCASFFI